MLLTDYIQQSESNINKIIIDSDNYYKENENDSIIDDEVASTNT